jgi:hypothetical protein
MDRKGLFTPQQEANYIASLVALVFMMSNINNKWLKMAISPVVSLIVKGVDNFVLDRIRPDVKAVLIPIGDALAEGRLNDVRTLATDALNGVLNIKYASKDIQLEFLDSCGRTVVSGFALLADIRENKKYAA